MLDNIKGRKGNLKLKYLFSYFYPVRPLKNTFLSNYYFQLSTKMPNQYWEIARKGIQSHIIEIKIETIKSICKFQSGSATWVQLTKSDFVRWPFM